MTDSLRGFPTSRGVGWLALIMVGIAWLGMARNASRKTRRANLYRHMVKSMSVLGDFTASSLCDHMNGGYTYTPSVQSLSMHLRAFVRDGRVRIVKEARCRREYRWVGDELVHEDP